VIGFFKILKSLIFVLTIVSLIVAVPPLIAFNQLKINPNEEIVSSNSYFSTTMGIMGAAGPQKFIVPYYSNRLKLFCENS
jgi:Mn2+/Fe2+ NRAMP family transporter